MNNRTLLAERREEGERNKEGVTQSRGEAEVCKHVNVSSRKERCNLLAGKW